MLVCGWLGQLPAAPRVIVIDPGHGGTADSGSMAQRTLSASNNATSTGGLREKALTLELSKMIAEALPAAAARAGQEVKVVLTRTTDTNPDFAARARLCAEVGASCIVSIHFNATGGPKKALGSLAMISAESRNPNYAVDRQFARELTEACNAAVRRFLPESTARAPISDHHLHGGQGSNFFFQLARHPSLARVPKCFLEVEFIDHPQVQSAFLDRRPESFRAVAEAIAAFLAEPR
ncbi:MAG: N-acetylmuramoyl-L-alanine amidase [Verrucomicrobia bacterium]|nr:N-acetylmuramoyl-L-alanine amidase [Verrucomicrobiota bacterium]